MEGEDDITIDMDGALGEIAEGLGFEEGSPEGKDPADDGLGEGETVNEEVTAPPTQSAAKPEGADQATTSPPAAGDPLATAPRTWRPEAAAEWDKLPPTVKAEIAKREEDMFRGVEQYKVDANIGKGFKQAVGRYLPVMQQYNIDPMQQVAGLMEAHYTLAMGRPDEKLALFQRLAADYGVNLGEAAVAQPPYVDPQVEGLQKKVQSLESHLTAQQQRQANEARQAFEAQVDKFAADPKNVHFSDVANDMAMLLEKGVAKDLADAYDKAVKLNPVVSAKEQQRQAAEAAKKQAEEAAAKAAAAKAATAANVRSRARAGSAATPVGSIDDTLNATFRDIMSRGS